jgi:hypothetical protein
MANFFSDFWKILKLDIQPYEKIKTEKVGMWTALRLFLVIALLAAAGELVSSLTANRPSLSSSLDDIANRAQALSDTLPPVLGESFAQVAQTANNFSTTLESVQPPLGKEVSNVLRDFGGWLSIPLSKLGGWMSAALAVFVVAKLFKGKGEIREHFSLFLLGFTPQILLLISGFSFTNTLLNFLVGVLNLAAWIWSLVIVTVALDVVHGFGKGKAFASIIIALVLSFLIFGVLIPGISLTPLIIGGLFSFR